MEQLFTHVKTCIRRGLMNEALTEGSNLIFSSDQYAEPSRIATLWYQVGLALIESNCVIPNIQASYNFYIGLHTGLMVCGMDAYKKATARLSDIITDKTHSSIKPMIVDCQSPLKDDMPIYLRCARAMILTPYLLGNDNDLVPANIAKHAKQYGVWEYFAMYAYTLVFHQNDLDTYKRLKCQMHDAIVEQYGQVSGWEKGHVAFFVDNCNHESADRRASFIFMGQLKNMGYHITLIYPATDTELPSQDICDDHIQLPQITAQSIQEVKATLNFECVFYFTHMNVWSMILASLRIGQIQCGMLGQVVTSALPSMDYFIMPKWDNPANYTETAVQLPGMGCALTTVRVSAPPPVERNDKVVIYCPWSVTKFTADSGRYLKAIYDRCPDVIFMFHVAGHHAYQHYMAKLALFIDPHNIPFVVSDDESEGYYNNFVNCDLVVISYPTSGFTTVVDALSMNKPVFAIDEPRDYSTCCAGQILKLLEFGDFVAPTLDTSVDNICQYVETEKYKLFQVPAKMERIVNTHNKSLAYAFGEWMQEVAPPSSKDEV
jgi:hypothetical protein